MAENLKEQVDGLRKANRRTVTSAVMISIVAHVVLAVIGGIWVVASYIKSDPPQFVAPPVKLKIPPQTKQHRMNVAAHAALASKPTFKARLVSLRQTEFALPEAPEISIENMLVPDPSTIASSMVTGLASGAGAGGGSGLVGADGKGLGSGINFMGIRADGRRIVLLFDVSQSVVNKAAASGMPLAKIKEETMKLIDGLPANSRFGIVQFVRNYKMFQEELVPATKPNRELAREWIENEWSETGSMPRNGRGVISPSPNGLPPILRRVFEMKPDVIFLITDGGLYRGGRASEKVPHDEFEDLFEELKRSSVGRVPLHFIGFQMKPDDEKFWKRLAARQGGSLKKME